MGLVELVPARPASAATPAADFEWSMQGLAGQAPPPPGRVRELRPDRVRPGPWSVKLSVAGAACQPGAEYRWSVGGQPARPKRLGECAYELELPAEGDYRVRLDATYGSATVSTSQKVSVNDWLIVSTGDSVASGESVPDRASLRSAEWQSARCHRSRRAAPAKAAQRLEEADEQSSVTFVHLACSGATVRRGLIGEYAGAEKQRNEPDLPPQIDAVNDMARDRRIDALLVSVGANDVHFGDVVRFCALPRLLGNCFGLRAQFPGTERAPLEAIVASALDDLNSRYDDLQKEISPRVARGNILLVEYFDPTRDAKGVTCGRLLGGISRGEAAAAYTKLLAPLNVAARNAAGRHGWRFVEGPAQRFHTHGYCARGSSWVTSATKSLRSLGGRVRQRLLGTLHPNEAGHHDTSLVLEEALRQNLRGKSAPASKPASDEQPTNDEEGDGGTAALEIVAIVVGGLGTFLALVALAFATRRWMLQRRHVVGDPGGHERGGRAS